MATDNTKTIAVFIYGDIQWGDGAQIGFNAGDGHTYFMLDEALSNQTLSMDERSNINQQGVFAFRIDSKMQNIVKRAETFVKLCWTELNLSDSFNSYISCNWPWVVCCSLDYCTTLQCTCRSSSR